MASVADDDAVVDEDAMDDGGRRRMGLGGLGTIHFGAVGVHGCFGASRGDGTGAIVASTGADGDYDTCLISVH